MADTFFVEGLNTLPSQDDGYFVISYQKGVKLILRLIMHY